jgi:thiol-disulfide isomerase/thioredoxin
VKLKRVGLAGWPAGGFCFFRGVAPAVAISLFALLVGLSGCDRSGSKAEAKHASSNAATDFDLTALNGDPLRLSDHRGKVVLVDFWATWCGPCRIGIPHLVELQREYGPRGLQIIGVAVSDREDNVRQFAEKMNLNYLVAMGNQEVVNDFGGFTAIPTAFLIAPDGSIAGSYTGYQEKRVFAQAIEQLLPSAPGSS